MNLGMRWLRDTASRALRRISGKDYFPMLVLVIVWAVVFGALYVGR